LEQNNIKTHFKQITSTNKITQYENDDGYDDDDNGMIMMMMMMTKQRIFYITNEQIT